jgi:factor associated with neutral sphingomyelinase activation
MHGVFGIVKNKLLFYPIVNCPDQRTVEFCLRDVKHVSRYRYMFQHNALELWMYNKKRSLLLVFEDKTIRENVYKHLKQHCEKLIKVEMAAVINRWINGEISNFEYLMFLNSAANRSFNDLSQYPIFPWVLSDYGCSELDLTNYEMYRDLSKPIGAINKSRLQLLKDNYVLELKDKTLTHPPCIYPTHYSTPGYVVYYLIRKVPEFIIKLQNGVFSPSERIFRSIEQTYYNSLKLSADFKELTP